MTTNSSATNPYSTLGLGITPTATSNGTAISKGPQTLTQDDFMKLLTTQLQNQDPTKPMDNNAMVAQMAQFSSLQGITQLNTTVSGFQSQMQSNQVVQASALVGKAAMVKGDTAYLYTSTGANGVAQSSGIVGAVDVPVGATKMSVDIRNSNGQLVKTIDVPINGASRPSFTWDGKLADGSNAPVGTYQATASATVSGQGQAAQTYVGAVINSVGVTKNGPQLNLAGLPPVQLSDVVEILN